MQIIAAASQQENVFNWQFVLTLVIIFAVFYLFRRMSRNAQAKQEEARKSWFTVGTNVVTTSGFLGTIVDIDGDAITLESPSGDESVWLKAAINQPMEIPLATVNEEESSADDIVSDNVSDKAEESAFDTDTKDSTDSVQE
ncbi:MAG: preprotein translocase subunit YajC [Actinomycetaceae bacterium]|nr:preprotein translocase subunit YajC [Actinomycetaceae bacterium]